MRPSATAEAMKARLIRAITIVITPIFLVMIMTSVMFGQSDHPKHADLIPNTELPWALVIVFAEETTVAQEEAFVETYGLVQLPGQYYYADPGPYLGKVYSDTLYSGYEEFRYTAWRDFRADTRFDECLKDNSCPPLFVDRVWYEPVTEEVAMLLQEEEIVVQLENNYSNTFFFLKQVERLLEIMKHITLRG